MRYRDAGRATFCFTIIFTVWGASSDVARAYYKEPPTLSAVVYSAKYIIKAKVKSTDDFGSVVTVEDVYQGDLKSGDEVRAATLKEIPRIGQRFGGDIDEGDEIILFLDPSKQVIRTGTFWISGSTVYVEMRTLESEQIAPAARQPIGLDDFLAKLKGSIERMNEVRAGISTPRGKQADIAWILKILEENSADFRDGFLIEEPMETLCKRLCNDQDFEATYQGAMLLPRAPWGYGFASPMGRDFLLAKIADAKTPENDRAQLMVVLGETGTNYQSVLEFGENSRQHPGIYAPNNAFFITRITRTAIANGKSPRIWSTFVGQMPFWSDQRKELKEDFDAAADALIEFYSHGATPAQQYSIESRLASISRGKYELLGIHDSPVVAIVVPDDSAGAVKRPGKIDLAVGWFRLPWETAHSDDPTGAKIVLKSVSSGLEYSLGGLSISNPSNGSSSVVEVSSFGPRPLPDRLRPGVYSVFLRVVHDDRVLCDSRGFEIDQDGTVLRATTRP